MNAKPDERQVAAPPTAFHQGKKLSASDRAFVDLLKRYPPGRPPAAALPTAFPGYTVLHEIGRGGAGVVLLARQLSTGQLVAIKALLAGQFADAETRERFFIEADALAELQHPLVVPIIDRGIADGKPFLALGYCRGGSLAGRLDGAPLDARTAAALTATVARAVDVLHARGHVHRDVKPSNILINEEPDTPLDAVTVRVADFGLIRLSGLPTLTGADSVFGTPDYMAPEQTVSAREATPRCDVFSIGVILYELLTGRRPFRADNPVATLLLVRECLPVRPRLLLPGIPRDLEAVCLKCLAREPGRRYATAGEVVAECERFLSGRPVLARSPSIAGRCWSWARRRPARAALIAVTFTALAAFGVGLVAFHRTVARERDVARSHLAKAFEAAEFALSDGALRQIARRPGLAESDRAFLTNARGYYQVFAESSESTPEAAAMLAKARNRIGRIELLLGQDMDGAIDCLRRSAAAAADLPGAVAGHPADRLQRAAFLNDLGQALLAARRFDEAAATAKQAVGVVEPLPAGTERDRVLAAALIVLATARVPGADADERSRWFEQAEELLTRVADQNPGEPNERFALMNALTNHGMFLAERPDRLPMAETLWRRAIRLGEELTANRPGDDVFLFGLLKPLSALGGMLDNLGHDDEIEPTRRQAVELARRLVTMVPGIPDYHDCLLNCLAWMASYCNTQNRPTEGDAILAEAVAAADHVVARFPEWPNRIGAVAHVYHHRALALQKRRLKGNLSIERAEIDRAFRKAIDCNARLLALDSDWQITESLAFLSARYATFLMDESPAEALPWLERSIAGFERLDSELGTPHFRKQLRLVHQIRFKAARALRDDPGTPAEALLDCARFAVRAARQQTEPPLVEEYLTGAVSILRAAVARALPDPGRILTLPDFESLHGRPDFQELKSRIAASPR